MLAWRKALLQWIQAEMNLPSPREKRRRQHLPNEGKTTRGLTCSIHARSKSAAIPVTGGRDVAATGQPLRPSSHAPLRRSQAPNCTTHIATHSWHQIRGDLDNDGAGRGAAGRSVVRSVSRCSHRERPDYNFKSFILMSYWECSP